MIQQVNALLLGVAAATQGLDNLTAWYQKLYIERQIADNIYFIINGF